VTSVVAAPTSSQNAAPHASSGEQCPALEPRGELGLQIEPDPERRVTEDVMDDSKLVDRAGFLAAEQWMRLVTRDSREHHRPMLAKLGT